MSNVRVILDHSGVIRWAPHLHLTSSCPINLKLFPLDRQTCPVEFASHLYHFNGSIQYQRMRNPKDRIIDRVLMGFLIKHEQWNLIDSEVFNLNTTLDFGEGLSVSYICFGFRLIFSRQPMFYILNIIIPCLIMSLMSILLFCLPIESGEKASFGITVLLSYTVVLMMVNDIVPRGGMSLPIISKFQYNHRHSVSNVHILKLFVHN